MASWKHCGACKLRWGRRAHIFDLTRQCQPSYHIILPPRCRVALGRAGHITLESLLRDPSPLEPSLELTLLSLHLLTTAATQPIAPPLSTSRFAPKCIFFAEKEQLLHHPTVDVDIVQMRKSLRIMFVLPPTSISSSGQRSCIFAI